MNVYDFNDVKAAVSIAAYVESKGQSVRNGRFVAWWRNSTSDNLSVSADGTVCCDHARGQSGGSVIDLCAEAEGLSLFRAAQALGERFGVRPKLKTRVVESGDGHTNAYIERVKEGFEQKASYVYTDEDGNALYTVLRMENSKTGEKCFLQRAADHWGIADVRRVLYNLPNVIKAHQVYIVEGEKDADNLNSLGLCATTNNSGAKNWDDDFDRFFQHKDVVILADNDEPGAEHAKFVMKHINDVVASVKVLTPSKLPKGDVTDYLTKEGGTLEGLMKMVEETPFMDRKAASAETAQYTVDEARARNATPFSNSEEVETLDEKGHRKVIDKPIHINELIDECRRRFLDFPRRMGTLLFDRDLRTGQISYLGSADALFSWISIKSKQRVDWSKAKGAVTQSQFYQGLLLSVKAYDGISKAPHFPMRPEIFYIHNPLPQLTPGEPSRLDELVDRFSPAEPAYRTLIKALIMAPMFFGGASPRPSWVVDSVDGKGVGKTTLVKMVADLYNETPIDIDQMDLNQGMSNIIKRLISSEGRSRRIALLDNMQGVLRSSNLARLITSTSVSGIAPYGRGEESRLNDITYVLTSNAAQLDDDIAQRSYTIKLRRMNARIVTWEQDTRAFIKRWRDHIFAEIIALLSNPPVRIECAATRYPEFESTVLCGACSSREEYDRAVESIISDTDSSNVSTDRAQEVEDVIRTAVDRVVRVTPGAINDYAFITTAAITHILRSSDTLRDERITKSEIMEMIQSGTMKNIGKKTRFLRANTGAGYRTHRGLLWIGGDAGEKRESHYVVIIGVENNLLVAIGSEFRKFTEV